MSIERVELAGSEEICMEVRVGEFSRFEPFLDQFLDLPRGPLAFLRAGKENMIDPGLLLSVSETLVVKGFYRESVKPLEKLISIGNIPTEMRDVALARAGQIAVLHGLPMDLGPILSELGLSRRDLGAALKNFRRRREKKDELREMEAHLLQALILDERAEHVESRSMGADHVKGALDGFQLALSLASDMGNVIGGYHRTRCMYHLGSFLLKRGEVLKGTEVLEIAQKKAVEGRFKTLIMEIQKVRAFYIEGFDDAMELLKRAEAGARELGNRLEEAEIGFISGNRMAAESGEERIVEEGIEKMLGSASIVEELGYSDMGASYRSEVALWCARTGSPKNGSVHARSAYKTFKGSDDREAMIRAGCILFLCYIRSDEKRKAKKLLLGLITNHPVKQDSASFGILREAVAGVKWLREDRDTRALFEDEVVYTIERAAVDEIIARAKEAYPNEFGAMLRGIPHITHIEPVMEGASNRNSFLFSLYSRFSQRNVDGEGVVHSHPSGSARPSRADLSMFGRFPGINIIIGYPYQDDSMAAYDRLGNRVRFEIVDERKRKR